ncbi:hypothetical protein MANES_S095222v8 [Manihot esculenta]|uniref:Uncharacterized protein n=1 Tax=Manihot esculenta TaxID=3983 RepID=A0ACB7FVZ4_MANES|nr:hypothetical protein MANES_S095222v8 [Manihot esculenta]
MEQNQNKNKGVAADCSTSSDDVERYFNSLPVGYRFAPSDDELIRYYLLRKINNEHLPPNRIHVVDLYNYSPQQLAETYKLNRERESQWYFFTSREKKYPKGSRPKRNARELGYWKATGTDKAILDGKKPLGFRKSLDYYEERQRDGTKTNWKMHEYLLHQSLVPSGATARGKNPLQPKQPLLCDNSLMISKEYENGYGSYLLPPLSCDPPQPILNNMDYNPPPNPPPMDNTFNNNFAYNVQPIQTDYPPSHYSNGFQPMYGCGDQISNCMETATMNDHLLPSAEEPAYGLIAEESSPLLEPAVAETSTREFDAQSSSSNQPMPIEGAYDHASSFHIEEERQNSLFDMLHWSG